MEALMNLLEVRVDAFAICRVSRTAALKCAPIDKVVVHFVLRGEGAIQCKNRSRALKSSSIVVVPRNLAKTISGSEPVEELLDPSEHCVLEEGIAKFEAGAREGALVLGCAAVEATIGGAIDIFEHLWEPMFEEAAETSVDSIMLMIERELANPTLGTRAVVSDLMKHVLICVFRGQLSREDYRSWLWPGMLNRELGRAAVAMMSHPEEAHSLESLAALAGMSRSRFAKVFTETFGRTPMDFLHSVRLRAAQRLLKNSSIPIKSIAAAVGYASRSHFCRAFKNKYGDAPSAYRARSAQPLDYRLASRQLVLEIPVPR